jgi:hypothetical protein
MLHEPFPVLSLHYQQSAAGVSPHSSVMELGLEVPGRFLLVDHSLSRAMDKGALGSLVVSGDERPDLFRSLSPEIARRHSRH